MRYDPNLPDSHFQTDNIINRWSTISFENATPDTLHDALETLRDACLNKLCDPVQVNHQSNISIKSIMTSKEPLPSWLFQAVRVFAGSSALDDFYKQTEQDPATRILCDAVVRLFHETSQRDTTQAERLASETAYQQKLQNGGMESPSTLSFSYFHKD